MTKTSDLRGSEILDSRKVSERLTELCGLSEQARATAKSADDGWTAEDGTEYGYHPDFGEDEYDELKVWQALADELSGHPRWEYGIELIEDTCFGEYAIQLAESTGAIESADRWPSCYIDWEKATENLKQDYKPIRLKSGEDYWYRA